MAAVGGSSNQTFPNELMKMLQQATVMKTLPDADVEWVIDNLETPLLMKIRQPLQNNYDSGASSVPPLGPTQSQPGGQPGQSMPPDQGGGGMGPGPGGAAGQVPPQLIAALQASQAQGNAPAPQVPGVSNLGAAAQGPGLAELQRVMQ